MKSVNRKDRLRRSEKIVGQESRTVAVVAATNVIDDPKAGKEQGLLRLPCGLPIFSS